MGGSRAAPDPPLQDGQEDGLPAKVSVPGAIATCGVVASRACAGAPPHVETVQRRTARFPRSRAELGPAYSPQLHVTLRPTLVVEPDPRSAAFSSGAPMSGRRSCGRRRCERVFGARPNAVWRRLRALGSDAAGGGTGMAWRSQPRCLADLAVPPSLRHAAFLSPTAGTAPGAGRSVGPVLIVSMTTRYAARWTLRDTVTTSTGASPAAVVIAGSSLRVDRRDLG